MHHSIGDVTAARLDFFVSVGVLLGMSTYRAPRKPYRAPSASVMGKGPKKFNPPGFAHLIAGQPSSQPKAGLGGRAQQDCAPTKASA
jgi:hypothetical protein